MDKLYAYVDESGQDTSGAFYVVSVVITDEFRDKLAQKLLLAESSSGKRFAKWSKSYLHRRKYIEKVLLISDLKHRLFYASFTETTHYLETTARVTAAALESTKIENKGFATVYIDGLRKAEAIKVKRVLRAFRIKVHKVRGIRKEENDPFIRLADALCGLVRNARDGKQWAIRAMELLQQKEILKNISK
jgi:hypothetical protein